MVVPKPSDFGARRLISAKEIRVSTCHFEEWTHRNGSLWQIRLCSPNLENRCMNALICP